MKDACNRFRIFYSMKYHVTMLLYVYSIGAKKVLRKNKRFFLIGHIESLLNEFKRDRVIREAACNFRKRERHESCPE